MRRLGKPSSIVRQASRLGIAFRVECVEKKVSRERGPINKVTRAKISVLGRLILALCCISS
jgi:hypothetical protein